MMKTRRIVTTMLGLSLLPGAILSATETVYAPPSATVVKKDVLNWVQNRSVKDQSVAEKVKALWAIENKELAANELFDLVIDTFALVDPESHKFVDACDLVNPPLVAPSGKWLDREGADAFFTNNMKLFYGRYLSQRKMYDEALKVLTKLDPQSVVDPVNCLFHKAVAQHQLAKKAQGLETLDKLMNNTEGVPGRYMTLAKLMKMELTDLKMMTLGHVARQMKDSERRLDLARGGRNVQKVQRRIIAELDEIIEKLEKQGGN